MSLSTNLVAYYSFNSGNSHDAVNGYNGTDTSMTYNSTAAKLGADGASFNGSSSYISLPSGVYSIFSGTNSFSFNGWFNFHAGFGVQYDVMQADNGTHTDFNKTFEFWISSGGTYNWQRENGAGGQNSAISGSTTLSSNTWYMITGTYDGTNMHIYLNGSSNATAVASSLTAVTSGNMAIGSQGVGGGYYANAYMDEIGFWSRALSSTEVSQLYNSGSGLAYPFPSSNSGFLNFF